MLKFVTIHFAIIRAMKPKLKLPLYLTMCRFAHFEIMLEKATLRTSDLRSVKTALSLKVVVNSLSNSHLMQSFTHFEALAM